MCHILLVGWAWVTSFSEPYFYPAGTWNTSSRSYLSLRAVFSRMWNILVNQYLHYSWGWILCCFDSCDAVFCISLLRTHFMIKSFSTSHEITLSWMSQNTFGDKSILVLVMAWCCQATSPYLNQCRPRSSMPYGISGPQWVNLILVTRLNIHYCVNFLQYSYLSIYCHWTKCS